MSKRPHSSRDVRRHGNADRNRDGARLQQAAESPRRLVVEVSAGELLDKRSILRLKRDRVTGEGKRAHVIEELKAVERAAEAIPASAELSALAEELSAVNRGLWDAEEAVRECE